MYISVIAQGNIPITAPWKTFSVLVQGVLVHKHNIDELLQLLKYKLLSIENAIIKSVIKRYLEICVCGVCSVCGVRKVEMRICIVTTMVIYNYIFIYSKDNLLSLNTVLPAGSSSHSAISIISLIQNALIPLQLLPATAAPRLICMSTTKTMWYDL